MRKLLLCAALALAACDEPIVQGRGGEAAIGDNAGGSRAEANEIATAYSISIISDNGDDLGPVRRYSISADGRIIGAKPARPNLEPKDAPHNLERLAPELPRLWRQSRTS
jgi:hypothetical protein